MKTSSFLRAAVALPALCSWLAAAQPAQAQSSSLTLEDISNWHYIPESYSVHSSTEGDNYARLSSDLKRIELFSFRDGSQTQKDSAHDAAQSHLPPFLLCRILYI